MLIHLLLVGIGGFFGAIARYYISRILNNKLSSRIPVGTLVVNVSGAFLLGLIIGVKSDPMIILLLGTGFLGAFTTFSTLKLEMIGLYVNNDKKAFFVYTAMTYGGGLILAYLGYTIGAVFAVNS